MKLGKPLREIGLLVLGLGFVGLATTAIIATFRGHTLGEDTLKVTSSPTIIGETPTTAIPYPSPYPLPLYYIKPDWDATRTAVVTFATQYAIMMATQMAITPSPTPPRTFPPTGTREDMYVKPSGQKMGLDAQNAWFGLLNDHPVDIYAGALSWDSEQGAIYIFVELPSRGFNGLILTPTKHGGVHVVSDRDNRLTLLSTDNTTYYFDLPARRFVASLTEIVPTATPLPTYTPFPPPSIFSILTPYPVPTYNPYPAPTEQGTLAP